MFRSDRKRVLYVDDDLDSYELMQHYLTAVDLIHAKTVGDGLRLARSGRFAVYLFDIRLADGTGIELCQQIRSFDRRTPVLFLSADARDSIRQQALEAGGQWFFTKPLNFDSLTDMIQRLTSTL